MKQKNFIHRKFFIFGRINNNKRNMQTSWILTILTDRLKKVKNFMKYYVHYYKTKKFNNL